MGSVREEIAKNLLYNRKKKGITQIQLAQHLGVNNSAVSNWEHGTNSIDIDTLHKVCEVLEISVNDMFGIYSNAETENISEHEKKVISAYRAKPEMQSAVDKLLEVDSQKAEVKKFRSVYDDMDIAKEISDLTEADAEFIKNSGKAKAGN